MAFVAAGSTDRLNGHEQRDQLTNGSCERSECKLHVSNLPQELNEEGIKEIFNSFGNVLAVFVPRDANWAYVSYKTHKEALLAVSNLDNKSPLNLRVQVSKERQVKNVTDWTKQNIADPVIPEEPSTGPDYRDSGEFYHRNFMPPRMEVKIPERFRSRNITPHYTIQDDIMYPVEHDPKILNPFENPYPYPETNLIWTRGRLGYDPNGRRQVVMGRGFTYYEIPNSYPLMEENVCSLYAKRNSGLYEYGDDQLRNEIGRCEYCGNITKMRCSKCSLFYCSRSCQKADWDKHKIECQSLPALTGIPNPVQELKDRVTILNQKAKERSDAYLKNSTSHPSEPEKEPVKNAESVKISEAAHSKEAEACSKPAQVAEKAQEMPRKPKSTSSQNSRINSDQDFTFQKASFLPKDKFVDVIVTIPLPNCEYFIQKASDTEEFAKLMISLKASDVAPKVEPKVGSLVAVKYDGAWHRALIESVNPLTAMYVDYGNVEVLTDTDIRDLGTFKNKPFFCRKIFIQNGKGTHYEILKENEQVPVKMISECPNGVINVIALEEIIQGMQASASKSSANRDSDSQRGAMSQTKPQSTPPRQESGSQVPATKSPAGSYKKGSSETPRTLEEISCPTGNVLDCLQAGEKGQIETHAQLKKNIFTVTVLPLKLAKFSKKILLEFPENCKKFAESESYTPSKVGELIMGQREDGDWVRGEVLSTGKPLKIALVDEGRVATVKYCLEMPSEAAKICSFAATCTFLDTDVKVAPLEAFRFEVVSVKTVEGVKKVDVKLCNESCSFNAQFTTWIPPPEQLGVRNLELKNNTEIVISVFRSPTLIYVRSLERSELERFNLLCQEIAKESQTAQKLKSIPVIGEMVIAKFVDGNFYRAIVTKVEGDVIDITYADYGNTEKTSMKNLWEISENLKRCPTGSTKIVLKNVPADIPLNEEVSKYLTLLTESEQPLKITFDGVPSVDGVELKTATRESVNEKVKQLLTPQWKEPEKDKNCYLYNDMGNLPLGEVGATVNAYILHPQSDGFAYFMAVDDKELLIHINDIVPQTLKNYVDSTTENYIPRDGEMCIAPYMDCYYRAACLQRNKTKNSSFIYFIDYGNMEDVEHKDLRLMTKDFMSPPALANLCYIRNLLPMECQDKLSDHVKQRITALLAPNSIVKIKILEIKDDEYYIELPEIRNILLNEKLI